MEWLRDSPIPSSALSNALVDFRKARSSYFRKAEYGKNRPRFASKNDSVQSFRDTAPMRRMEGNRYPLEALSSWIVKRESGVYYLVLLFNVDVRPKPTVDGQVGIDVGVKDFLTLSTGEKINYPDRFHQLEEKVRWEQRKLSRRVKGSSNYRKQKATVAKAYVKLHHFRENFQHQLSHKLIEDNQFIGMETLVVGKMTRKAKKKLDENEKPLRNGQASKRAMNRSILRNGWSSFAGKLAYKAQWYGRTFVRGDMFYPSSRLCNGCGNKYVGLRLSEREWVCESCGASHDRDVNAALNILGEALRLSQASG